MIEPGYHQVIAGNKTQTRRSGGLEMVNGAKATKKKAAIIANPDDWEIDNFMFKSKGYGLNKLYPTPHYKVGEVLYLKEPVSVNLDASKNFYYYDLSPDHDYRDRNYFEWPNKLFMPARAARAFIRITAIRCERLLDISDHDAIAEGIEQLPNGYYKDYNHAFNKSFKPKDSFISLYIFANKIKPTAEIPNIFVWAYTFEYLPNYKI